MLPVVRSLRCFPYLSTALKIGQRRIFATPIRLSDNGEKPTTQKAPEGEDRPLTETVRDFLAPSEFYSLLKNKGLDFYAGVPDSLLKDYCAYITDHAPATNHVIAANEGAAVALATGYHLATRKYPIVYMQNSGFGNTINPLLSLCDPKVYSIPMLLLIGWRGEPGKKDEPQHVVQGKVMSPLLTDLRIQYEVLPDYIEGAREALESAVHYLDKRKGPYAFLVKRQTFTPYKLKKVIAGGANYELTREKALEVVAEHTGPFDILVATTGFTSRELYEYRARTGGKHEKEFLTVGSMGHASSIALGIALKKPSRQVFVLDGDGALLMHMGAMATIGCSGAANFKHVLVNNGCHDSVGGQPTVGFQVDFPAVARACGYRSAKSICSLGEVGPAMQELARTEGPCFLEVRVRKGARKDLGRPTTSPLDNKNQFMDFLDG